MSKRVRTAIFPVAGLGTRFLPATKAMPKEMLTVVDRPLIQYAVDEAREAGIEHFVFVTGRNKGVIEDHFDRQYELEHTLETRGKTAAKVRVTVHVGSAAAAGKVVLKVGAKKWKTVTLHHGTVVVRLSKTLKAGKHRITAVYQGAAHVLRSKSSAVVKVKKGTPKVVTVAKNLVEGAMPPSA